MRFHRFILIILAGLLVHSVKTQDLHLTNYRFSPLFFNPAHTGAFHGSYRVAGAYRDQYSSFIQNGYKSQFLTLDSPIDLGFGKHHWVGWGFTLFGDKAGDIALKTSGILGSAAYHIAFDKDYSNVLTIGAQYGIVGRKFGDTGAARFADVLSDPNMTESADKSLIDAFNDSYNDLNIGLMYRMIASEQGSFETGVSVHHILDQGRSLGFQGINHFGMRINAHGLYCYFVNNTLLIEPAVYVSLQDKSKDISLQLNAEYLLRGLDNAVLTGGIGYRAGDAIEVLLGGRYKDWQFGIAYDITVSSASTFTNYSGGLELGVLKILKFYKRPEPDPTVFCPRF